MLTRRIDRALSAFSYCQERVPELKAIYEVGSPQALALDDVLASIDRAKAILFGGQTTPP